MSLFGSLFKKGPVVELRDPVFGLISYDRGIWTFLPAKPEDGFMISVVAPEVGPSDLQRAFFTRVRSELIEHERRARDYMAPHLDESVDISQLSIYSVLIGDDEETQREEFVMELADKDVFLVHWISFKKGETVDYGFDD